MRTRHFRAALTSVALLALALPGQAAEDVETRLDRGEILVSTRPVAGSDMPEAVLRAVVDAPPERVWRVIDDCGNYKKTMPRVEASRQLERGAHRVVCEVTVDATVTSLTAVTEATNVVGPPQWSRRWKLVKGDYTRNEGGWTLEPFGPTGKRTRVTYRVHAEPKVSIPSFMLRKAQRSALPDLIERLRQTTKG